jgi:uncharacterized Ntn-hydrolase superfamily protein
MGGLLAATFSIVGRCKTTKHLGIAIATKMPAVGAVCPFVRFGVGAVTTQAWVNPYLGPDILDRLAAGATAHVALAEALPKDPDRALRQVGVVDAQGRSSSHTGADASAWAGHRTGPDFAAQGNTLVGKETVEAMAKAFVAAADLALDERLLRALEAGQAAGGDKRGKQSAALIVHGPEVTPLVDLRVDEHADPVAELRRIHTVCRTELFPYLASLPTRTDPKGGTEAYRARWLRGDETP